MTRLHFATVATVVALVATLTGALSAQQTRADVALRAAMELETVRGDLKGAIEAYKKVVDTHRDNRAVAAQALLRLAEAYQKQGDPQARAIYQRVVEQYADQTSVVSVARTHLAAPVRQPRTSRTLWTSPDLFDFWGGSVSPDGRFMSFTDWSTGNLRLHDFVSGNDRSLTNVETPSTDAAVNSAISRDGRFVAYAWASKGKDRQELLVLGLDASGTTAPRTVFDNADVRKIVPADWSPDGRSLAVELERMDGSRQLALIATSTGALRQLKTIEWRGIRKALFSPDGRLIAYDLPASDTTNQRDVFVLNIEALTEVRIIDHAASDLLVGWSPTGDALLFSSFRTGTQGLWVLPLAGGQPRGSASQITADLPLHASFGITRSGALVYGVESGGQVVHLAAIDPANGKTTSAPVAVTEFFARPIQADWSPDGRYMVTHSRTESGSDVLSIIGVESGEIRPLKTALAYIQQIQWISDDGIVVRGRDRKGRSGLHRVDARNGETEAIALDSCPAQRCASGDDTQRLIHSVSPNFKSLFFADDKPDSVRAIVEHDRASGLEREVFRGAHLNGFRLSPDGRQWTFIQYDPAARSYTFNVWSMDRGDRRELFRVEAPETLTNLVEWSADSRHILFGRRDARQREVAAIIPTAGGPPVTLELTLRDGNGGPYRSVHMHPDGRRILLTSGSPLSWEVRVLENFLPSSDTAKK